MINLAALVLHVILHFSGGQIFLHATRDRTLKMLTCALLVVLHELAVAHGLVTSAALN